MVALRKEQDWLVSADFELLNTADQVFAYQRVEEDQRYLVVVNLSSQVQRFELEEDYQSVLISNTDVEQVKEKKVLEPWDAFLCATKRSLKTYKKEADSFFFVLEEIRTVQWEGGSVCLVEAL